MDTDIRKTIQRLDQRIKELQVTRQLLVDQFGEPNERSAPSGSASVIGQPSNGTRKSEVIQYLKQHGPASRKELLDATHMPDGTIGFVLKDKSTFQRLADGTWWLVGENLPGDRNVTAPTMFSDEEAATEKT